MDNSGKGEKVAPEHMLKKMAALLVSPSKEITDIVELFKAKLLGWVYLAVFILMAIYSINGAKIYPVVVGVIFLGFYFSRTKLISVSGFMLLLSISMFIVNYIVYSGTLDPFTIALNLSWMSVPIVLAGWILSVEWVILFLAGSLGVILTIPIYLDGLEFQDIRGIFISLLVLSLTVFGLALRQKLLVATQKTHLAAAEQAYEAQQSFLWQVIDANTNLVFAKDRTGRYTLANRAQVADMGMSVNEILGKTDRELGRSEEFIKRATAHDRHVFETGEDVIVESGFITDRQGEIKWYETTKRPLYDREGKVNQVFGIVSDVTKYKLTEENLRKRNQMLEILNELSRNISETLDLKTILAITAKRIQEFLGVTSVYISEWDQPEGIATVMAEYISTEAAQIESMPSIGNRYDLRKRFKETAAWLDDPRSFLLLNIDSTDLSEAQKKYLTDNGIKTSLAIPIFSEGHVFGYIEIYESRGKREYVLNDIEFLQTAAYQLSAAVQNAKLFEALQKSLNTTFGLLEAVPDPIFRIDDQGIFLQYIPGNQFDPVMPPSDFINKPIHEIFPQEVAEKTKVAILKAIQTGDMQSFEYSLQIEHEINEFEARLNAISDNEVICLVRDITEAKRAKELVIILNEELEAKVLARTAQLAAVNQELNDFAYVVSHDLKAPLRGIMQLSEWLQLDHSASLNDEGQELIQLMQNRASRLHHLIDDILEYSRIGRVQEKESLIDTTQLVEQTIEILMPHEDIRITIQPDLPKIMADRVRVEQVFQNLIGNAIKFMDKKPGSIMVEGEFLDGFYKFKVIDNGPGISEEYHSKIFQIFQTLEPRDKVESTGIGLALVKKIVEGWNGEIGVESSLGEGSTFWFTIPIGKINART